MEVPRNTVSVMLSRCAKRMRCIAPLKICPSCKTQLIRTEKLLEMIACISVSTLSLANGQRAQAIETAGTTTGRRSCSAPPRRTCGRAYCLTADCPCGLRTLKALASHMQIRRGCEKIRAKITQIFESFLHRLALFKAFSGLNVL